MAKHWRKHDEDWQQPLIVEVQTNAGEQPWHKEALLLRAETKMSIRQISKRLGVGFSPLQRLFNPESKRKAKIRQAAIDKAKRHNDPAYAEKTRTYLRKYMQLAAAGRWKE